MSTVDMLRNLGNGQDGIVALRVGAFDVLLTDIGLPGMSGSDLAVRALALGPP